MRVTFRLLLLLPLLVSSLSLAACGDTATETDAARAADVFYSIRLSEMSGGLPEQGLRARLKPVITPSLDALLAGAVAAERRHLFRTRNQEPPYVQGDLFSSLYEGPTVYRIGTCHNDDGMVECEVHLTHDVPGAHIAWTDRIRLIQQGERWLVDNIVYGGEWDFALKGTLRRTLEAVIDAES